MAAFYLSTDELENNLVMNHHKLLRQLEAKYRDYIKRILQQKRVIVMNLQKQFIEQRYRMKQQILHRRTNHIPSNKSNHRQNKIKDESQNVQSLNIEKTEDARCYFLNTPIKVNNVLNVSPSANQDRNLSELTTVEDHKHSSVAKKESEKKNRQRNKNKKHECPHCNYSSNRKCKFDNHLRTHSGEKPFVCTFGDCKKRFAARSNLRAHMKRHVGDKQHLCPYCSKAFIRSCELRRHIRVHTGEKPFECKQCKRRFRQRAHLLGHEATVHK